MQIVREKKFFFHEGSGKLWTFSLFSTLIVREKNLKLLQKSGKLFSILCNNPVIVFVMCISVYSA